MIVEKNGPNGPVARFYNNNQQKLVVPVLAGSAYGDGYYPTPKGPDIDYSKEPGLTGAGIYTINWRNTSPYLANEPMMDLYNYGAPNTRQAMHGLASQSRWNNIEDSNPNNNRVTNGCVTLPLGVAKGVFDSGIYQNGDTVYVIPEVGGNYITEDNGKLKTIYEAMPGNNPTHFTLPNGFSGPLLYNNFQ